MEVIELSQRLDLIEKVVQYFWKCWGNESNFSFYNDCIQNSINPENDLPKFYIVLENQEIIASYTLLINDIISRQDLMPWFACLYVNKSHRNQGIAEQLLNHALEEAKTKGFSNFFPTLKACSSPEITFISKLLTAFEYISSRSVSL